MSLARLSLIALLFITIAASGRDSCYSGNNNATHFQNVKPEITGQSDLSTLEEAPITIGFSDLEVYDPDNDYPEDFTMELKNGEHYSVSETTIHPETDFYGSLTVKVTVDDGEDKSRPYDLKINVAAVNDPPVITGQNSLTVDEDGSLALSLSDFSVSDPDNSYPEDFSLTVYSGSNYSVSGTTITPAENFSGTLTVPVSVNDGTSDSEIYNAEVTVKAVNDVPVITGQSALQIPEDQSITITPSHLTITDPDNNYPDDFSVSVQSGTNYSVSGTTITPAANFSGTLSVPVTVSDGDDTSAPFNLQVDVAPVNDQPVITGQDALTTPEEQSITLTTADVMVTDPDDAYPADFTLTANSGDNYSLSGNTITPAADFNGTITVPVTVNDGELNSEIFNVEILVSAVNDTPVITGQNPLSIDEDESLTLTLDDLLVTDPDNDYPEDYVLNVSAGNNYTVEGAKITPSAGFNGTLSVPVTVSDGSSTSSAFSVQIQVSPVNNLPVITGQTAAQTQEEQSFTITTSHLTVSDPDNSYPSGFTLNVQTGSDYSVSGATVTPAANFTGTLSVPVTVNDGTGDSAPFNFQITVTPVNDPPVITGQEPISVQEDNPVTIQFSHLIVTDPDNAYPSGFTIILSPGANYSLEGTSVVPLAEFSGVLSVPVTISDGTDNSAGFNLSITVTAVNDAPVITGQAGLSIEEEGSLTLGLNHFIVSDPDNNYPDGFSLTVKSGSNYTVSGNTITAAENFTGTLTVGVSVSDGAATSTVFNATVNVGSVNDAPEITGQVALQLPEDQSLTIQFSQLTVTDTDNTYPQDFSIQVNDGDHYSVSGSSITPEKDYNGLLTVPVTVNDGTTNSNIFELQVTVEPVNDLPVITGQLDITTYRNKAVIITLEKIIVSDPDSQFPESFTLQVLAGPNYTVFQNTVTPANDFVGVLKVPVTVFDGSGTSESFTLDVNVVAPPNVAPVITSQVALTTYENEPITLDLAHLVVTDPDNRYPDDFTLTIFPGEHYSFNQLVIMPEADYSGTLQVKVTVSDKEATSQPFIVEIRVLPVADVPLITSQAFIRINEGDSVLLNFGHIVVLDPDNSYPTGFTMSAGTGTNYAVQGLWIKPVKDFNGYLSVPVTVNDGVNASAPYQLLILVDPVNDAPVITDTEPGSLFYSEQDAEVNVFKTFKIGDVDDDTLSYAEIVITPEFQRGLDTLTFENSASVRGIFDTETSTLIVFGAASVSEYESFIHRIGYRYSGETTSSMIRNFSLSVNDGKATSTPLAKEVVFGEPAIGLDIPGGFTPNGDGANDTWSIKALHGSAAVMDATIRVYNKRGAIVFEGKSLDQEWDGRMNGNVLPADSYFYTIDLQERSRHKRYKGVITILR